MGTILLSERPHAWCACVPCVRVRAYMCVRAYVRVRACHAGKVFSKRNWVTSRKSLNVSVFVIVTDFPPVLFQLAQMFAWILG